jgi:hypothetical protein
MRVVQAVLLFSPVQEVPHAEAIQREAIIRLLRCPGAGCAESIASSRPAVWIAVIKATSKAVITLLSNTGVYGAVSTKAQRLSVSN